MIVCDVCRDDKKITQVVGMDSNEIDDGDCRGAAYLFAADLCSDCLAMLADRNWPGLAETEQMVP
jgi:hypothetical protein